MVKKIVVIGAGIVGLATACRLGEEGYSVTILERNGKPAEGTSKANGGQLIYNFGAMGSPGFLKNLPATILNPAHHGVIVSGLCHPRNWFWALSFVRQSTSKAWLKNTLKLIVQILK